MNMLRAIEPKSDQMNAEDLLSGERTFTITKVKVYADPDRPVSVWFAEFPEGRPFKPSKTVNRLFVALWGEEEEVYVGRRVTLYRDPRVKWAGKEVGGIRVKAMSHIGKKPISIALAESDHNRATWVVHPLPDDAPTSPAVDEETVARLAELRQEWKTADDERKVQIQIEVEALS